ncbi:CvpA family protein [Shouchella shacheensis]|uniref:CvpA family protein n=1 Tax=Shouchella shacheensis TaxID=1649580 RepID=UPI0007404D27|nr:CvpA family protein [Shouchella shacheensis]
MVSLIIMLLLLLGFFVGRRRGFILQLIHLIGFIVSIYVAVRYYQPFAETIRLYIPYPTFSSDSPVGMMINSFNTESVYYSAIAFAILFFGTKIVLHIVGSMLDFVANFPVLRSVNRLLGGVLGFVETYLLIFILVFVLSVLQVEVVQERIQSSIVAQFMINDTPFLSEWIRDLWLRTTF